MTFVDGAGAAPAGLASSAKLPGGLGPRPTDTTIRAQGALLNGQGAVRPGSQARPRGLHENAAVERRKAGALRKARAAPQGVATDQVRLSALHLPSLWRGEEIAKRRARNALRRRSASDARQHHNSEKEAS